MKTRYFALVLGFILMAIGIAGFVPGFLVPALPTEPPLVLDQFQGRLWGVFPTNLLADFLHVGAGLWGVASWREFSMARAFCRFLALLFAPLALLGLIPALSTLFGLMPLHGGGVVLHGVAALLAAGFAWVPLGRPGMAGRAGVGRSR